MERRQIRKGSEFRSFINLYAHVRNSADENAHTTFERAQRLIYYRLRLIIGLGLLCSRFRPEFASFVESFSLAAECTYEN